MSAASGIWNLQSPICNLKFDLRRDQKATLRRFDSLPA